jgi:pimeloyl-ACP methyl ester carboxylesterase
MAEVRCNDVALHVQRLGSAGSPVTAVFVHGLVMDNLSSWYFTVANPASHHADVILYDLRGHGRSERPPSGYSVADMVSDLAGLLDALDVQRPVVLIGNSFGGLLALVFAIAMPERVAGVVLVDAHLGDEGFATEMAATLSLEGPERDRMIAQSFQSWMGRHSERKRNRLAATAQSLVRETSLVDDMRATSPLHVEALRDVTVPVLAVYGERSDLRERSKPYLKALPQCEVVVLPGCTHSVLWEATEEVRRRIVRFLESLGDRA